MLEINQLTVAYDERPVLRDFSLRMKDGGNHSLGW